ncbi:YwqG family protein [Microcoleus sp. B4-C5]|uniref:YwqG family protein n=1 Tax=unclassified Microcoleus TaxID=2642155 RepID=UPI002FD71803
MKTNLDLPAEIEPFRQEIESSEKPVIKITYERKATDFWSSKFGGVPYLPKGYDFPKDSDGKYMHLLAQLNFEEIFAQVPYLAPFPKKGILQFYIGDTDFYGMDLDKLDNQKDFKILYFSEIDTNNCQTDFAFLLNQELEGFSPLNYKYVNNSQECLALQFNPDNEWVCRSDYQFKHFFEAAKRENLSDLMRANNYKLEGWYHANIGNYQTKIGGYAYFTQDDPREESQQYKDHKVLLLQMMSDNHICWGDCGVGNFFIRAEDLKKLDFSQVIYNYDCH